MRADIEQRRCPKLKTADRRMVEDYLDIIATLLAKRGSSQAMTGNAKVDVFDRQKRINAALAGRPDYRVCSVEGKTGSHFKKKECASAARADKLHQEEHDALARMYQAHPLPGGGDPGSGR